MRRWLVEFRSELTVVEQFVLAAVALMPFAWLPVFVQHSVPRVAVAVALLPLGLVVLIRSSLGRDRASQVAVMIGVVAVVSSLASPAPFHSITGSLDWWMGAVGLATAFSWWAIGHRLSASARRLLIPLLTAGALWNGAIAFAQVGLDIQSGTLAGFPGRGTGTMLNPVYYGAFMSGVLAAWIVRFDLSRRAVTMVVVLSFGVGLSGGRIAVAMVVVVALVGLVRRDIRRSGLVNLAAVVLGVFLATLITRANDGVLTVTERMASAGGGGLRADVWRATLHAVWDRPVLGWGPANVELATERQFDLGYVQERLASPAGLDRWLDAHNIVLNLLVSVGLVGAVLLAAFAVYAGREAIRSIEQVTARSALAAAVVMCANWMLQPATIHTVPLAMLLFGAAGAAGVADGVPRDADAPASGGSGATRRADAVAMTAGCIAALTLSANMFILHRAIETRKMDTVELLTRIGYRDPLLDDLLTTEFVVAAAGSPDPDAELDAADRLARRAAESYPVHYAFERVGEISFIRGDLEAAVEAERRATSVQPWYPLPYERMLVLADRTGDSELRTFAAEMLCRIDPRSCPEARWNPGDR